MISTTHPKIHIGKRKSCDKFLLSMYHEIHIRGDITYFLIKQEEKRANAALNTED